MKTQIASAAFGLALLAGTSAAQAQTVITRQITDQPVETVITQQPVQTVQTVRTTRTTRTIRPARTIARRRIVTTRRTIVSQRVLPRAAMPAPTVLATTYPQPLYDAAAPPRMVAAPPPPYVTSSAPLYDEVGPSQPPPVMGVTPIDDQPVVAAPGYAAVPTYRYVYEPDRILVIDPATNIAIQALPR